MVRLSPVLDHPVPFSTIDKATGLPRCLPESGLRVDGPKVYGLADAERYRKKFLALRPDFTIDLADELLILLEAKSAQAPPKRGGRCKEDNYYDLLNEGSRPLERGLYYVVPQRSAPAFAACVAERFPATAAIQTGIMYWEDLLHLIADDLMGRAIGEILKITDGIQQLRSRRKARRS
jgi:hypothetical protein